MPMPTTHSSISEKSSNNPSDKEIQKEHVYSQVCRRINQFTFKLDKLNRQALPACKVFLNKYERNKL